STPRFILFRTQPPRFKTCSISTHPDSLHPLLPWSPFMPKYVIERDLPGAGKLTSDQLRGVSQKSCDVLNKLGPEIQWIHSYVTADKIYCIYRAPSEAMIREHAKQGGFPANKISEVANIIEPTTAE